MKELTMSERITLYEQIQFTAKRVAYIIKKEQDISLTLHFSAKDYFSITVYDVLNKKIGLIDLTPFLDGMEVSGLKHGVCGGSWTTKFQDNLMEVVNNILKEKK